MKKIWIIIMLAALVIISILAFFYIRTTLTAAAIEPLANDYSFTKAICNESNFCQDYEFVCDGSTTISMSPVAGSERQFGEDWSDPRPISSIEKVCE